GQRWGPSRVQGTSQGQQGDKISALGTRSHDLVNHSRSRRVSRIVAKKWDIGICARIPRPGAGRTTPRARVAHHAWASSGCPPARATSGGCQNENSSVVVVPAG